jgi:hypothetical protein
MDMSLEDIWIRSIVRDGMSIRDWSVMKCCREGDRLRRSELASALDP